MRAKTINEIQNFERGLSPRAAMEIGGVNFNDMLYELEQEGFQKLKNSIEGKTITVFAEKIMDAGGKQNRKEARFTIHVNELETGLNLDHWKGNQSVFWIIVNDIDGNRYKFILDQKIYIE